MKAVAVGVLKAVRKDNIDHVPMKLNINNTKIFFNEDKSIVHLTH